MTLDKDGKNLSYDFDELAIWRTKLPEVKYAILPPSNNRPNPLVFDGLVFVSVFAPGAIRALDRNTGMLVWRRELHKYASAAVHVANGTLFAQTPTSLHALKPATGQTVWSFCPYGESGETMYSAPTIHENSVFIGDRCGYLYCLDFQTGRALWKQRTSEAKNCDLNSTPLVTNGMVVVGTNANMAAAYDAKTGNRIWLRELDGPSLVGPLLSNSLSAVFANSVYFLVPESGDVVRKFGWEGDSINHADCVGNDVLASIRPGSSIDGVTKLVRLSEHGARFTQTCEASAASLIYANDTKMIYVSHIKGLEVRHSDDGAMAFNITRKEPEEIGAVDVKQHVIYAATGDGFVYALKHPSIDKQ
ncbi:MAG: PQQ-binding-like beta-propeller repeat protein [Candidatus Acidiferrales bacterium]|jgi:outer membrane protein assembly factor BamB